MGIDPTQLAKAALWVIIWVGTLLSLYIEEKETLQNKKYLQ